MNFEQSVIQRSHQIPVLVDFWAPWCGPCRTLGPILDAVAEDFAGRLELVKLNTEEEPELAGQFGIRSIPHCKLFVAGEVRAEFSGALPQSAVEEWLNKELPSPLAGVVARARQAMADGDAQRAQELLVPVLEAEPGNAEAILLSARAQLWSNPRAADELLGQVPVNADLAQQAEQLKVLARLLADPPAFESAEAAQSFEQAVNLLRSGACDAAVDALLASLKADRHGADDAARKAILGLMAWAEDDAAKVQQWRSRLSAVLFS